MRVVLALALVAAAACAEPRSPRCKQLCAHEAACVEDSSAGAETAFDEGDCIAACAALERDAEGRGAVERHADCLAKAGADCAAVLACP
ncbi:MAG: hypothetical protein R2939_03670 [Kofleriaceae bacterium]